MQKPISSKNFSKQFGQYVKKKRLELHWSQADLATKMENNYQNISRLERGEVNPTLLWCYKLADAFEMDLAELIKEFGFKQKK
jgi:ribosome-binding protein aMBF1 (putative translation factor)